MTIKVIMDNLPQSLMIAFLAALIPGLVDAGSMLTVAHGIKGDRRPLWTSEKTLALWH